MTRKSSPAMDGAFSYRFIVCLLLTWFFITGCHYAQTPESSGPAPPTLPDVMTSTQPVETATPALQLTRATPPATVSQTLTPKVLPTGLPTEFKTILPTSPSSGSFTLEPAWTPPISAVLSLALGTSMVKPPGGEPGIPLYGVSALAVDPNGPAGLTIVAGTNEFGVLISRNNGQEWFWSASGLAANSAVRSVYAAHGEIIVLLEAGGAYISSNGDTWKAISGLSSFVERIVFSPTYPVDGMIFAVQNGALLRSSDRAKSWVQVLPQNGCPLNVTFSPDFPSDGLILSPRCNNIAYSIDGGLSWTEITGDAGALRLGQIANLAAAPDGKLLAQGSTQNLPIVSGDGGRHWEPAYNQKQAPFSMGSLRGPIKISASGAWYLVGNTFMYDPWMRIWCSTDQGLTWYEVAQASAVVGLEITGKELVWVGTWDGIYASAGGSWRLVHPGGSRPTLVDFPEPGPLAITRQSVGKYTSRIRVFEKEGENWQLVMEEASNYTPLRGFPAPDYPAGRLILLLSQDYGGQIHLMALRPGDAEALVEIKDIPVGTGDFINHYRVQYDPDYAENGRIELVHGKTGALYLSNDHGASWNRPDPAEQGACQRNPVSGFGALWYGNRDIRNLLLCPLEDEQAFAGTVQPFERGELLRLEAITNPDHDTWIYLFLPDWNGRQAWNTMPFYDMDSQLPQPPEGLLPPDAIFVTAWLEGNCCLPDLQPVRDILGWAIGETKPLEIARQRFEGGTMIWRGDLDEIWVLEQTVEGDTYLKFPD